jgi:hypothetical protein
MAILSAAVALVAALCVLDLLLTFGVIRRLRQHAESFGGVSAQAPAVFGLAPGERVAAFSAVALDGAAISAASELRVAGFFAAGCSACPAQVGPFTEYLASHEVGEDYGLAVVVAPRDEPPAYLDRLRRAGRVCVVDADSELLAAFKVGGFPAFCVLDGAGVVVATGYDPAMLPAPAAAI